MNTFIDSPIWKNGNYIIDWLFSRYSSVQTKNSGYRFSERRGNNARRRAWSRRSSPAGVSCRPPQWPTPMGMWRRTQGSRQIQPNQIQDCIHQIINYYTSHCGNRIVSEETSSRSSCFRLIPHDFPIETPPSVGNHLTDFILYRTWKTFQFAEEITGQQMTIQVKGRTVS